MDFISNKEPQNREMLDFIGINSVEELFNAIPINLQRPKLAADDGISEYEGLMLLEALAKKNTFPAFDNYLGAGAYEHHIPAIVGAIASKSEFLTAYTPYQAEASQGMLQIIFEFQSAICALTQMDASNASLYDGASACAEAILMALRQKKGRKRIIIPRSLNPHYSRVVEQYLVSLDVEIFYVSFDKDGMLDENVLRKILNEETAAVLIQSPNFFGIIEEAKSLIKIIKNKGALAILCSDPTAYGLFASAGELDADIAVGDCQPFGLSLQFGGPYAGYLACRQELVRQMPGRIVGETVDDQGRRGFVLTLQAREQHIRREKATSNICTNQALAALSSLVAILWYGKQGVAKLALTNYQRAAYLKTSLGSIPGITLLENSTNYNEFAIKFPCSLMEAQKLFRSEGIEPGISLGGYYPKLDGYLLIAVTETKSIKQLDRFIKVARACLSYGSR
jgi:glycine dehydrogenase subunit 1